MVWVNHDARLALDEIGRLLRKSITLTGAVAMQPKTGGMQWEHSATMSSRPEAAKQRGFDSGPPAKVRFPDGEGLRVAGVQDHRKTGSLRCCLVSR